MKDIFIFGASSGAAFYLSYIENANNYRVIGFIDNDKQKHNQIFEGKPVYSPEILHSMSFDEVHIASMWEAVIKKQLIHEFSVAEERIILPEKRWIKSKELPFASDKGQLLAKSFIADTCSFFKSINVPLYLDFGCLLGICRDKELIRWDDDIDFLIREEDRTKVRMELNTLIVQLKVQEFFNFEMEETPSEIILRLVPKGTLEDIKPVKVDFYIGYEHNDELVVADLFRVPKHFLSSMSWIDLYPGKASTFNNPHEYLTHLYGDWKEVKKEWKYSDYHNI